MTSEPDRTPCGQLVVAHDWTGTGLGAIETWPRTLRGYVSMVMEMPTPGILFWGPDLLQIYNDGYAAIMGPRHPAYFGARYRDCWPETYLVVHPWMVAVLERGEVTRVERTLFALTRHGFPEEAYFTFTFSPLRDDTGAIAGILQPVVETTDAVLGERRARTLRALSAPPPGAGFVEADLMAPLGAAPHDLPFTVLFVRDDASGALSYAAQTGLDGEPDAARLAEVARRAAEAGSAVELDDVATWLGRDHHGPWPEPTARAIALPLRRTARDQPLGVIVLAISPRLRFDEAYRAFFESVATQLAASLAAGRAKRAEVELRRAAEAANHAKDEFLAILGHELRNPLSPILTSVELLRARSDGLLGKEIEIIRRQARHLVRLVDDLLDVSRITRGKVELRRERLEVARVVDRALEMTRPLFEEREHELVVEVPRTGLAVDGDPERLAQVLANLLSNAAKYTEQRGRVSVVATRRDGDVVVRVRDTGMGIDPAMLPRIFEMFAQERQSLDRAAGGLGLGLAIVRQLVELHGGTVAAHSEGHGLGSELVVSLPAAAALPVERAPVERAPSTALAPAAVPQRILVVDDNEDAAEVLADALSAMGHTTLIAHDGATALRIAGGFAPDVGLLDIGLPGMDGYALARSLRREHGLESVRLIAVTGYGQASDRQLAHEAGFDAHLVKPVSLERLSAVLRDLAVSAR